MKDKTKKYRGSHTHGRGSKKKGRGKGEKGGKGLAGGCKHKHLEYRYGKKGFIVHGAKKEKKVINVGEIERFKGNEIDLKKLGYEKLLGAGIIEKKVKITISSATEKAIEKIKSAGGEVITD